MTRKRTIIIKHFIIWIVLSLIWFFSVEALLKAMIPEVYDVEQWIATEFIGILLITTTIILSMIISLLKTKRKQKATGKLA